MYIIYVIWNMMELWYHHIIYAVNKWQPGTSVFFPLRECTRYCRTSMFLDVLKLTGRRSYSLQLLRIGTAQLDPPTRDFAPENVQRGRITVVKSWGAQRWSNVEWSGACCDDTWVVLSKNHTIDMLAGILLYVYFGITYWLEKIFMCLQ